MATNPRDNFNRYKFLKEPMLHTPAHKQTDLDKLPGQFQPGLSWDGFNITGDIKSIQEVKGLVEKDRANQVFKSAFVRNFQEKQEKKLTFHQWYMNEYRFGGNVDPKYLERVWDAAQENK